VKFDRSNPKAWIFFLVTAVNIVLAAAIALVLPRRDQRKRGTLSGHLFNGNLRAFFDVVGRDADDWEFRYVYIDYGAYRSRRPREGDAMTSLRLDHMIWVARSDVVMTDHAAGIWSLLQRLRPQVAFVDVWHGVGFRPLGGDFGERMARYHALFAASEWDASQSYVAEGGASAGQVIVTGYASVDPLLRPQDDAMTLAARYELPPQSSGRLLIAPTWNHGDRSRQPVPFGLDDRDFFRRIDEWARREDWTVIFRAHLNASITGEGPFTNTRFMPLSHYPITHDLLQIADVLITDWSSIATEYLVLNRPMIFFDTPAPFPPTRLEPEDRVGYLVSDWEELVAALGHAAQPGDFENRFGKRRRDVLDKAFGSTLDGHSSRRYLEALNMITKTEL
jgi:CDP-glycerol glycerophosphotransferase (TagB/SpsB family)